MSLDIYFEKTFTIKEVKDKTQLNIEFIDGKYRIEKDNSYVFVKCENNNGDDNDIVYGLTRYGSNYLFEILKEIVLTIQTKFIDDDGFQLLHNSDDVHDEDKLFTDTIIEYGYKIDDNGIISSIHN